MFQASCHSDASRGLANRAFVACTRRAGVLHVCVLVVALFAASIAQARMETILWTHALDHVAGFRMYLSARPGPSGSVGIADIVIAEAAQNQSGVFFYSINVPDEETVYITLTAYSDEVVESIRSNEKILAPPAISRSDGDEGPDPDDPTRFEFTNTKGVETQTLGANVAAVHQGSRTDPASGDEIAYDRPLPNGGRRLDSAIVRENSVDVAQGSPELVFINLPGRSDPTVMDIGERRRVGPEGEVLTRPGKPLVLKAQ